MYYVLNFPLKGILPFLCILLFTSCEKDLLPTTFEGEYEPTENRVFGTDGDDVMSGSNMHAGYGNDLLVGTTGDDVLNGGHGLDRLEGGEGNDLLISRSDGREARVKQNYISAFRDPDGEINEETKTRYGNKPLRADDVLNGGPGADVFRFITHMNAKERFIRKHAEENGHIHWHDIAGENTHIHDHWVDRIGNDVIEDFNRDEGDKIEFIGHTLHIKKIDYVDINQDGKDETRITLISKQAPGGAHHMDRLGIITIYGDKVNKDDYIFDSEPAIGIIHSIENLGEALHPLKGEPELGW